MSGRNKRVWCNLWRWLRIFGRRSHRASRMCRHLCHQSSLELVWLGGSILENHRTMALSTTWFPKDCAVGWVYLLCTMPRQGWSRRGRWQYPSKWQIMSGRQVSYCLMSCYRFHRSLWIFVRWLWLVFTRGCRGSCLCCFCGKMICRGRLWDLWLLRRVDLQLCASSCHRL